MIENLSALMASYDHLARMREALPPGCDFLREELDRLLGRLAGHMLALVDDAPASPEAETLFGGNT